MTRAGLRFNYNDYLRLPGDDRYEILQGGLYVVPAPSIRHQRVSRRLEVALVQHVEAAGLGEIFDAPCDVILSDDNVVQPDILFVRKEHAAIVGELNLRGAPDLVMEILSPGSRNKDLEIKRRIYAEYGVQEYWLVDPEACSVEVLVRRGTDYELAGAFEKRDRLSTPILPELNLALDKIFAD